MTEFTADDADGYGDLSDPFVLKQTLARLEAEIRDAFGGGRMVLTQAEYDALDPPDGDILYIVTGD